MTRTVSAALEAHLALECTTLATLWKVTRTDAEVFGFTDHDKDLTVSSVLYRAASGYTRSAVRASLGLAVDNLDVQGALDDDSITTDDLRAGLWDYAAVEIMLVNWASVGGGVLKLSTGQLGQVRSGRGTFAAELFGLGHRLNQSIGRLYLPACDADLGDTRCGVSIASFTVTGTVTSVTSRRAFADGGRLEADGYFDGGKLTFTSGGNSGRSMEVKTYAQAGAAFTLQIPMPYDITVGATYSLQAGCNKTFATCGSRFSNAINYQGFPHLAGMRRLVSGRGG